MSMLFFLVVLVFNQKLFVELHVSLIVDLSLCQNSNSLSFLPPFDGMSSLDCMLFCVYSHGYMLTMTKRTQVNLMTN